MPANADLAFPLDKIRIEGCHLTLETPGKVGGRTDELGIPIPQIKRGQYYWKASLNIASRMNAVFDDGLLMESFITRIQRGQTIQTPVYRNDSVGHKGYRFLDASDNEVSSAGVVTIATGNKRFNSSTNTRIILKAGCVFTVDNILYQYDGSAGDTLDATATDLTGIYPDFQGANPNPVELENPYFVGFLRQGDFIEMPRNSGVFGPWSFDLYEVQR